MTLTPDTPFPDFMDKVMARFHQKAHGLYLKFKDEGGGKVSLRDESDYVLAIETARESAKGKAEEVWYIDISYYMVTTMLFWCRLVFISLFYGSKLSTQVFVHILGLHYYIHLY